MSDQKTSEDSQFEREFIEDTPENRSWIGETEPQPVEDSSENK